MKVINIVSVTVISLLLVNLMACSPKKTATEKFLKLTVVEMNKKCPMMVDKVTRLDSTNTQGTTLNYYYTLLNADKSMGDFSKAEQPIAAQILSQVKTNPQMKGFRDNDVTLGYNYMDKNGNHLFEIKVTPEQYK